MSMELALMRAVGRAPVLPNIWAKKLLARYLSDPSRTDFSVRERVQGYTFDLDLRDYIQSRVFLFGMYDRAGVDFLRSFARIVRCHTLLDVGANIGNHAIHVAPYCRRVICFEPNPTVHAVLVEALARKPDSNIVVAPYALGERDDVIPFHEVPANLGMSSFEPTTEPHHVKPLRVCEGDAAVRELGVDHVDLVKLDVEGFELEVLRGLQATLAEQQPLIVMEYGPVTRDKAGGGSKLRDLLPGYRLFGHAFTRVARLRLKPLGFHLTAFDPERTWDHAVCVPQRYLDVVPGTGV